MKSARKVSAQGQHDRQRPVLRRRDEHVGKTLRSFGGGFFIGVEVAQADLAATIADRPLARHPLAVSGLALEQVVQAAG